MASPSPRTTATTATSGNHDDSLGIGEKNENENENENGNGNGNGNENEPAPDVRKDASEIRRTVSYLATRHERLGLNEGLPNTRFPFSFPAFRRRITVEAMDISDDVFYIPPSDEPYTAAESVRASDGADYLVQPGEGYSISFVGLSVSKKDFFGDRNELLMYSLRTGGGADDEDRVRELLSEPEVLQRKQQEEEKQGGKNGVTEMAPTGFSNKDVVRIHYDPLLDGHNEGTKANVYVEIGAGKSTYLIGKGKEEHVRIRFSVIELDRVTDLQARAISGIDQVGSYVSEGASMVPYGDLVANTFAVASELGRMGLKKYSQPDHVMSRDFGLGIGGGGVALRYGYYVFMSESVRGRLYLQTGGRRMAAYWRRIGATGRNVEFVPISGMSYVVVKVGKENGRLGGESDWKRLENILEVNSHIEMLMKGWQKQRRIGGMSVFNRRTAS